MYNSAKAVLKGLNIELMMMLNKDIQSTFSPMIFRTGSDSDKEEFFMFDVLPQLKEHLDRISMDDMKDFKYDVINKAFVNGIRVNRDTLSDSRKSLGAGLENQVNGIARKWNYFADKLVNDLLVANGSAFDGTAFFANSRPNIQGSATIDNLLAATGVTLSNLETDLELAKQAIWGFKDRNGDPFNIVSEFLVLCPPQLEQKFRKLANSELIDLGGGAITNSSQGTFKIIVNPYQSTSDNDWYLFNIAEDKPFIILDREAPEFDFVDDKRDLYIDYFTRGRIGSGYGNPMASVKIDA